MKKLFYLFFIYVFVFIPGCEKDKENPADSNSGIFDVNGSWTGKTSQDENISFKIEENWMKELNIKINVPGGGLNQHTSSMICYVENYSFSYSTTTSMGKLEFTGNFRNNNSSAGTFRLGSTEGTWTASK